MNRINRCTSRMWSRPSLAASTLLRVLIAGAAADSLVAARAERPAAVLLARPVARQQHAADIRRRTRVLQRRVQLVDGVGPERVAHLRPVEGDADRRHVLGAVVRDVGELEALDGRPQLRAEGVAHAAEPIDSPRSCGRRTFRRRMGASSTPFDKLRDPDR